MGKHSMMCSTKSIYATPTDGRTIIKSWKKSDARYSEMAAAFDRALAIVSGAIFSPERRFTALVK
jgi:hypothetical protein